MAAAINRFDRQLTDLINGNNVTGVLGAPTEIVGGGLKIVLSLWTPFKALLEDNVDTFRDASSQDKEVILKALAPGNIGVLKSSNKVVGQTVDAAKAANSPVAGLVVDIAGRQRMLIQKMCKETLFIALGFNVASFLASLKGTSSLFRSSHSGVSLGAPWAGVPELTAMCTIQVMCDVTYAWQVFKPSVDQILGGDSDADSQRIASQETPTIAITSNPLFAAQVAAVKLFVKDDGSCKPLASIDSSQWSFLLNNVGKQRFLGQQVTQLFMQIANGVDVQDSKVALSVNIATTTELLRSLIEGSRVNEIPPPPTQAITDKMMLVYEVWRELRAELQAAVDLGKTDSLTVAQVARQSRKTLVAISLATDSYEEAALQSTPSLPSHVINMAGRQRMLFQKISKEASMIAYGEDVAGNWVALNSSRDMFTEAHWVLLLGKLADSKRPAIIRTTDVCVIQQMKLVADTYGKLEQAALQTASGNVAAIEDLIKLSPVAFSAMNTAVGFYTSGSASCGALDISFAEWTAVIREIGHLRMLSQKASTEFLLVAFAKYSGNGNSTTADRIALNATITGMHLSLKKLKFGAGVDKIPAAPTQGMVDYVFAVDGMSSSFIQALEADDGSAVASASQTMLVATEKLMTMYMEAAEKSDPTVPGNRMDMASRQLALAETMVKEALLLRLGFDTSRGEKLDLAIASFAASQRHLQYGGNGVAEVIRQRQDLLYQSYLVDQLWI
ncbi:unnamed protein product, partial [Polarella glacialis]